MGRRIAVRAAAALAWAALALPLALTPAQPARAADAPAGDADGRISELVEGAVVKVFATTRSPDLGRPWARQPPGEVTGSGVVIDGHRILTNAHVVSYAVQVQVQADREGDKFTARVAAVAPGIDLAVLTLEDESFFERHAALARSNALPSIKDTVLAYGFPVGGTSLSITKGIVSRIEFTAYNGSASGLRVQIDAAINPGNSGGPATVGDRMIGLAFSALVGAQNIGYIIPNEEIELFLRDIADGNYDGKPHLHDELQTLENPALRAFLKLPPAVHGVVVHRPYQPPSGPENPLREWDVITAIGGVAVDDQGMILVGRSLRLGLRYEVQHAAHDGRIGLDVMRDGKALKLEVPVPVKRPGLLEPLEGGYPSYFIYGPVVFERATLDYVAGLRNGQPGALFNLATGPLLTQMFDPPGPQREELVVVPAPLFPHPIAKGYGSPVTSVVQSVNGIAVRSLAHLVGLLRDLRDDYVVIAMDSKRGGEGLVFKRADVLASSEEILSDNGVRAQGSADMMRVWQGEAGKVAR